MSVLTSILWFDPSLEEIPGPSADSVAPLPSNLATDWSRPGWIRSP